MGAREVPRGRDCHVEDLAERGRGDEHATGRRDGAGDDGSCYQSHVAKEPLARPRVLSFALVLLWAASPHPPKA